MQIKWTKRIWNRAKHNAFTDLCEFAGGLFCAFREATDHISPDGVIRILHTQCDGKVKNHTRIALPGADLRDPKLSVTPDGKLLLIAYARFADASNKTSHAQSYCWFSSDGISWSGGRAFGPKNWWLWRISWRDDKAMGLAYNRDRQAVNLHEGDPRRTFLKVMPGVFSQQTHGKGYPNESDIALHADKTAYTILRRDADSCTAQLGIAKPPYRQWQWHDLQEYIGGPACIFLNQNTLLIAGRRWRKQGPQTAIWTLNLNTRTLALKLLLPSAGDCSYPGLERINNTLFVSYYSSHQDGKSAIYLTEIGLTDEEFLAR